MSCFDEGRMNSPIPPISSTTFSLTIPDFRLMPHPTCPQSRTDPRQYPLVIMESQRPLYRHEICQIYLLVENTSLRYVSVNHLRELGIEAKQVELSQSNDKLQFDPCFFEPQHLSLHCMHRGSASYHKP